MSVGRSAFAIMPCEGIRLARRGGDFTLAAYCAREMFGSGRERIWARARATAEALKAEIFIFRAGVEPYTDTRRGVTLLARLREIQGMVGDVEPRPLLEKPEPAKLTPLTVERYLRERIEDQVDYYRRTALLNQRRTASIRTTVLGLGVGSVVLAMLSSVLAVSSWTGVCASAIAGVAAFAQSQRYTALTALYLTAARRLEALKADWYASGKSEVDKKDRDEFIRECERVVAMENEAWASQWSQESRPVAQKELEDAMSR
jgi:hypothetical protein